VAASRRLLPFLQTCTCGWKPQPRSLCAFATPALHREWGMNSRSDSPIRISFARAARRYGLCPQVFMVPAVLLRVTEATEFQNPISGLSGFQRPQCFISSDSPIGLRHAKETVLGRMPGPLWRGRPVRRHTCPRKQGGFRGVAVTNRRHGPDRSEGAGKERGGARQVLAVEAEESAEIPYYQRSSASICGSIFLFPVYGSGQDAPGHCGAGVQFAAIHALAKVVAFDGGGAVTNRRRGPNRSEGAGKERGGGAAGACG
jgi:hypothetical protein